jgi:hypothetical protein
MSSTKIQKPTTRLGSDQVLQRSYNDQDSTLITSTFITSKIGNNIQRADTESGDLDGSAAGDDFSYYDGENLLYTLRVLYSDADKTILTSVTRVA